MTEGLFEQVFVYGTLLNGESNNALLQNAESHLIGEATIKGFDLYNLGHFPGAWYSQNAEQELVGEVWKVSPAVFQRLDWLESYPTFYTRVEVETQHGKAWIYICPHIHKNPKIASGNWRKFLGH